MSAKKLKTNKKALSRLTLAGSTLFAGCLIPLASIQLRGGLSVVPLAALEAISFFSLSLLFVQLVLKK